MLCHAAAHTCPLAVLACCRRIAHGQPEHAALRTPEAVYDSAPPSMPPSTRPGGSPRGPPSPEVLLHSAGTSHSPLSLPPPCRAAPPPWCAWSCPAWTSSASGSSRPRCQGSQRPAGSRCCCRPAPRWSRPARQQLRCWGCLTTGAAAGAGARSGSSQRGRLLLPWRRLTRSSRVSRQGRALLAPPPLSGPSRPPFTAPPPGRCGCWPFRQAAPRMQRQQRRQRQRQGQREAQCPAWERQHFQQRLRVS